MNRKSNKSFIVFLALCMTGLCAFLHADDKGKSQTAAAYLWITPSIRAAALGSAFTGLSDDSGALYYNQGGIALTQRHEISLTSSMLGLDRKYNYMSYIYSFAKERNRTSRYWDNWNSLENREKIFRAPAERYYGIGIAMTSFGVDAIDSYDEFGNKGAAITDAENTVLLGFGINAFEDIYWGINLKLYSQTLSDVNASGFGADMGFLFANPKDRFTWGVSFQNIAAMLKWKVPDDITNLVSEYSEPIQMTSRLGAAYRFSKKSLLLTDIDYASKQNVGWHIGHEYMLNKWTAVRVGMDNTDPTFGMGFALLKKSFELEVDYAYVFDTQGLSNLHRLGLTAKFLSMRFI
ncbi:MAG: hypothetical protein ABII64_06540 [Elusimicrobiota bacterium]